MKKLIVGAICSVVALTMVGCSSGGETAKTNLTNQLDRVTNSVNNVTSMESSPITPASVMSNYTQEGRTTTLSSLSSKISNDLSVQKEMKKELSFHVNNIKGLLKSNQTLSKAKAKAVNSLANNLSKYVGNVNGTKGEMNSCLKFIRKSSKNKSSSELTTGYCQLGNVMDSRLTYFNNLLRTMSQIEELFGDTNSSNINLKNNNCPDCYKDENNNIVCPDCNNPNLNNNNVVDNPINNDSNTNNNFSNTNTNRNNNSINNTVDYTKNDRKNINIPNPVKPIENNQNNNNANNNENNSTNNNYDNANQPQHNHNYYRPSYMTNPSNVNNNNNMNNNVNNNMNNNNGYGSNGINNGYNNNGINGGRINNRLNPNRNTDTYGPGFTNIDTYRIYPNGMNNGFGANGGAGYGANSGARMNGNRGYYNSVTPTVKTEELNEKPMLENDNKVITSNDMTNMNTPNSNDMNKSNAVMPKTADKTIINNNIEIKPVDDKNQPRIEPRVISSQPIEGGIVTRVLPGKTHNVKEAKKIDDVMTFLDKDINKTIKDIIN